MIEIWGKPHCPYCERAKQLCEMKGARYTYKELATHFTREEVLEEFPGARTFPQIKIDGVAIGGYDQLKEHYDNQDIKGMTL